jgi:hypothetical protein
VKTLLDIKQDMSSLYDELKAGTVDIKIAGELANISGKYLKAEQLDLAREIFTRSINQPVLTQPLKEIV